MPTTTNYGWTTPADTDLVKDGASAIRTLGTAIDTTVFNNAGAAIAKTIVDAKGDIIAATAADTVSRLAVGSNDTVLTADSSTATGLKWATVAAGGKTLLSTTTLTGSSVTISSIDQTYKDLSIYIEGAYASTGSGFQCQINGITSNTYGYQSVISQNSTAAAEYENAVSQFTIGRMNNYGDWNVQTTAVLDIFRYAATDKFTKIWYTSRAYYGSEFVHFVGSATQSTAQALSSITFKPSSGTFSAGTVYIYGVK